MYRDISEWCVLNRIRTEVTEEKGQLKFEVMSSQRIASDH